MVIALGARVSEDGEGAKEASQAFPVREIVIGFPERRAHTANQPFAGRFVMRDVHVYWQRSDHTFTVVRSDGALVADRLKRIEDAWWLAEQAWRLAEQAQRDADAFRTA
jgi:hypothetical protein